MLHLLPSLKNVHVMRGAGIELRLRYLYVGQEIFALLLQDASRFVYSRELQPFRHATLPPFEWSPLPRLAARPP